MLSIKVCIAGKSRVLKFTGRVSVENLLERLCINPDTVVVLRNGEVTPEFERLSEGDRVEIIDIVSRG
jgi:sulfur carrier protein ThiS